VVKTFLDNRDAYAFDPRNPNSGFRYLSPPKMSAAEGGSVPLAAE
jgi:serine protease Do